MGLELIGQVLSRTRFDKTVSLHELGNLVARGGGVVLSTLAGFFALKTFLRFGPNDSAILVALIGYLVFVPLAQMGFGRPCYGEVRERFIGGRLQSSLMRSFLDLFGVQAIFATILFSFMVLVLAWTHHYGRSWGELFFFACGQGALASGAFQRDIAYAVSDDTTYETWELLRKGASLVAFGLILVGFPLWFGGLIGLVAAFLSQIFLARRLLRSSLGQLDSATHRRDLQPKLGVNARRYMAFSINEVLFYNLPLLVFTFSHSNTGIIYFGIWMKLFFLIVLPMRMLVDARVNRQTGMYFSGDKAAVWSAILHSAKLAACIVVFGMVLVALLKSHILRWIGVAGVGADPWFLVSIAAWAAGNSIQHVFGSFTVSYRDGFVFAFKASLLSLMIVGGAFTGSFLVGARPGLALFAAGVAYCGCALIYVHHVRGILDFNRS